MPRHAFRRIPSGRGANTVKPRARIDYIWAAGPIAARVREARVLYEGAFRVNPEDPTSFALSDHLPILAKFGPAA